MSWSEVFKNPKDWVIEGQYQAQLWKIFFLFGEGAFGRGKGEVRSSCIQFLRVPRLN